MNNSLTQNLVCVKLLMVDDAIHVYSLIDESRSELKNLVWSQTATLESTTNFIETKIKSQDSIYGVYHDSNLVGVLELRKKDDMFELGYWVGTKYRGKGFMKIAVKNLVDEQSQKHTITAHIREINQASYKILQYAGLTFDHVELWESEQWVHLKKNKQL